MASARHVTAQSWVRHLPWNVRTHLFPKLAVQVSLVVVSEELGVVAEDSYGRGSGGDLFKNRRESTSMTGILSTGER